MKTFIPGIFLLFSVLSGPERAKRQTSITGAWISRDGDDETVFICQDNYIIITEYNPVNTAFYYSSGGRSREIKGQLIASLEFTTNKSELQQREKGQLIYTAAGNKLSITKDDKTKREFTRIDDGTGNLAGVWKKEAATGDEQTLLILSGTRFQRVRFNAKTRELVSSYGGHYKHSQGNYTEHISFYRKDPDMIGKSVSYTIEIKKDRLTIKGKNEKGEAVEEEWGRKL